MCDKTEKKTNIFPSYSNETASLAGKFLQGYGLRDYSKELMAAPTYPKMNYQLLISFYLFSVFRLFSELQLFVPSRI
jgi:hypothetical protein